MARSSGKGQISRCSASYASLGRVREFIRQYFHHDIDDVRFYDLVINTDRVSIKQAADSILPILTPDQDLPSKDSPAAAVRAARRD
jgi:hypothetical protein